MPLQLSSGQWDCNVSYYDSFKQHFSCIAQSFCVDKRDKLTCPDKSLCGSSLVEFGGSCYRVFKPQAKTTWNKASETCGNYGGSLAVLNGPSKLLNAINFTTQSTEDRYVFIGLRMQTSMRLHGMYQNTWVWSDDTLAVYLPITFVSVKAPYCAVMNASAITLITCDEKVTADYLCETDFTPDQDTNDTQISLNTPPSWNTGDMAACRHGHTTYKFLACDVDTNCSAMSHEESLACSNKFSPPVPFFTCRNQLERVPYTLVCDFRSNCCDGSDEDFCDFPQCESRLHYECSNAKQCINRDRMCDKRSDCVDGSDEFNCRNSLTRDGLLVNTVEPPASVDFTGDGSFTATQLINDTCPNTHFRCAGQGYCLPVYVRCNGFYDCPGKKDEEDCDQYTCPGFYRCRKSKICLHEQHLCDGVFQCPERDDELICNFTCPEKCHCYGHAFICNVNFTADSYPELRYVDASGTGMNPEDFVNNTKLIHLSLRSCNIRVLTHLDFSNLQILDLSYNNIHNLDMEVFDIFVTHLSMADFLMGVYLAIIGIADRVYYGLYRWYDVSWKHSISCKLAGFLSLVSSEVSAFLICLITLERFLVISFPHKNFRFSRLSAHLASVAVWIIGLTLAVIPLLPATSHWEFYSQSGICIPLPVTNKEFGGSGYSFAVIIVINFVLFLFIAVGQLLIYWSIRVNTVDCSDSGRKSRDTAIARRLLSVVLTDFVCWFPIGVLGIMARSGVPISGDVNVAIAIFVLPFNSALNPFLYTLNIVIERRRKASNAKKSQNESQSVQNRTRVFDVVSEIRKEEKEYSKEEAFQLFQKFLEDGLLTPDQIRKYVWEIYEG
ncbi:uncharacterized protein LOC143282559 [Babylonia areolata]|uniref:uncharacterized protein LOC143282559 n=1 Tax=Babylonia areolata TaxID=304850 RepID=UPI003FD0522E